MFRCVSCTKIITRDELCSTQGKCPTCNTHLYLVGENALIISPTVVASIHEILDDTIKAWKIMSDVWGQIGNLRDRCQDSITNDLKEAQLHAYSAFQEGINGTRDHLKILIDML